MVLGGLALAFSRLIDNSVVVLENIYRHLEMGESPEVAAEKGGTEVALPVLAATLTTVVVFFPVTFLYGVSKFLFTALALAVVLSLFASYRGRHDGGAAVLRAIHQSMPRTTAHRRTEAGHGGSCRRRSWSLATGSTSGSTAISSVPARSTTSWCAVTLRAAGADAGGFRRVVCGESSDLSVPRACHSFRAPMRDSSSSM